MEIKFGPNTAQIRDLMMIRRYLREAVIPSFQGLRESFVEQLTSALELCLKLKPEMSEPESAEFFEMIHGEAYKDIHAALESEWERLCTSIETIESRVRELTGKSADELDAEELAFWDECNKAQEP